MIAKQLVTGHVIPLKPTDTGLFALLQMEEARLSHLPIVDGANFIGVISEREIQVLDEQEDEIGHYNLTLPGAFIHEDQHLYKALELFSSLGLTMLPVVNEKMQYMGAIILSTVVEKLTGLIGLNEPGGVIVLEIGEKDLHLADLIQVVETNDAKILSCFVQSMPDSTKLEVTIKVNRMEIGPLLQSFFRLNYLVTASWSKEDSFHEGLQDRFDALMNYLNI
ncbi:MAG: CBS domain-containing protein [Bacteroidales bacterium]